MWTLTKTCELDCSNAKVRNYVSIDIAIRTPYHSAELNGILGKIPSCSVITKARKFRVITIIRNSMNSIVPTYTHLLTHAIHTHPTDIPHTPYTHALSRTPKYVTPATPPPPHVALISKTSDCGAVV
jgi:hypothetical protein